MNNYRKHSVVALLKPTLQTFIRLIEQTVLDMPFGIRWLHKDVHRSRYTIVLHVEQRSQICRFFRIKKRDHDIIFE